MADKKSPKPRLKEKYNSIVIPQMKELFDYKNVNQVPNLEKIVVNMGVGGAAKDSKLIQGAISDLSIITGQYPRINKAKKSIANFKLREGQSIGASVTLRGARMWEFLDRLLSIAVPRVRDFRGLSARQFDAKGNYTFGLQEQSVFHEINQDNIDQQRGMDITIVTTAKNDDEGRSLLLQLGFPFKPYKDNKGQDSKVQDNKDQVK
ncbi:MAG: 50S ribosomal protein L5 [Bifidobacteriaceae bacterium]|jgi:large subunit ribosomal protein L5|nr:50S ribosomal protein L5 [Bifidobacteriaceae bacterium]